MSLSRTLLPLVIAGCLGAADPSKKIFPYAYDQYDLPNGLRVVTVPTDFPNVVALYIVVQTGSRNEVEPGKTGFAHFFEHMMFRGTRKYPPARYNDVIQKMGAHNNAYTSDDHTAYHTTLSKQDLEELMEMEADRFQNLDYDEAGFRTEALAVLGEYNKNSAAPMLRIEEVVQGTAFREHTYRHTTMGFLEDIKDMPNQFAYSRQFFDRYYRPEYTTILVVGDVKPAEVKAMVAKYWGEWKRGSYKAPVPAEPPQDAARTAHIDWATPTLPWVITAFRGPAYSDTEKDSAVLDAIAFLGFSENSPLYQKLVLEEQKVDALEGSNADHVDPYLFLIYSRVKKKEDMAAVRDQVLSTLAGFKDTLVPSERLQQVKRHLRYRFALGLDDSEAIARTLARYISLRRTPETVNRLYELYAQVTPEDIRAVARKYFVEKNRTVVTLMGATK